MKLLARPSPGPAALPAPRSRAGSLLGAALAALTVLMGMALLGLSGWFITATALAGLHAATAIGFDVFMPSAGIRLLALGRTASRYGERLVTHDATFGVLAALRERLFRGWARPDAARQLLARPARLLFRLTADIDALESLYLRMLVPAAAALGAALLAGIVLGFMNPWMGLVLTLWLIGAGWGIALCGRRSARGRPRCGAPMAMEALRARAVDLVAGQTELVMAGRIDAQREALAAADRHLAEGRPGAQPSGGRRRHGLRHGRHADPGRVLLAVGALAERGRIGAPAAALALLVALDCHRTLRRPAPRRARSRPHLAGGTAAGAAHGRAQRAPRWPCRAADEGLALQLNGASRGPSRQRDAPHCTIVSLALRRGERVALIGPSGAGKSTLARRARGRTAAAIAASSACSAHCLLTQRTELFQDSLRDNLRLADPAADDARLWRVLQAAGLPTKCDAMAAGLDTRLGEGGLGLSGGQSRRLALARLLLRDVPFWLLDEPTEALDTATAHDVLQRLASRPQAAPC